MRVGEAFGAGLADVAQRGEVADVSLAVGRVHRLGAPRLQLSPVALVGRPLAADLGAFADREVGDGSDHDHLLAGVGVLDPQYRVAAVLGAIGDREDFDRARVPGRIRVE